MFNRKRNTNKLKNQEQSPFSIEDIFNANGVDRHLKDGSIINQLIIDPAKRGAFFEEHPDLLNLLKR
ncbi:MAG: hypothetical protein WC627_13175 [Legionella sp.]